MITADVQRAVQEVAALQLCRTSFVDFLRRCTLRSDDPLRPERIPLRPWDYQVERAEAWERGASEVILKERQLGFSAALVAPYLLWRAMYHGWAVGYWSKGQAESRDEISRIRAIYESLPEYLRVDGTIRVDDAEFEGGGTIAAFPSTPSAGISHTLQLAVLDEAAFHPHGAANYAAIQPAVARGQVIILSTADPSLGPAGFFYDMFWRAVRGEVPYDAVFAARCRPDRDEAWYARARAAHPDAAAFDAYYPTTPESAFVGREGLVYPTKPALVSAHPFTWEDAKLRLGGVDFGGGDPTVALPIGISGTGRIHQYDEFYRREPVGVAELGAYLMQFHARAPFLRVFCDPSEPVAIQSLKAAGLPAVAADNRRDGIALVGGLYEQGRVSIHESCTESWAEFGGYRWAERTDPHSRDRYATSTPVDNHADGHDARRYTLIAYLRAELKRQQAGAVQVQVDDGRPAKRVIRNPYTGQPIGGEQRALGIARVR